MTGWAAKPAMAAKPVTVKPATPAPVGTPPKAASAPAGAPEADGQAITPSTREAVWERFCKVAANAGLEKDERNAKFLELVSKVGKQTDYDNWTGEDWGLLMGAVLDYEAGDDLPF